MITSSAKFQSSYATTRGTFVKGIAESVGYDYDDYIWSNEIKADSDGDGKVTWTELYTYCSKYCLKHDPQDVQAYAPDMNYVFFEK